MFYNLLKNKFWFLSLGALNGDVFKSIYIQVVW